MARVGCFGQHLHLQPLRHLERGARERAVSADPRRPTLRGRRRRQQLDRRDQASGRELHRSRLRKPPICVRGPAGTVLCPQRRRLCGTFSNPGVHRRRRPREARLGCDHQADARQPPRGRLCGWEGAAALDIRAAILADQRAMGALGARGLRRSALLRECRQSVVPDHGQHGDSQGCARANRRVSTCPSADSEPSGLDGGSRAARPAMENRSTGALYAGARCHRRRRFRSPVEEIPSPLAHGTWLFLRHGPIGGSGTLTEGLAVRCACTYVQARGAAMFWGGLAVWHAAT